MLCRAVIAVTLLPLTPLAARHTPVQGTVLGPGDEKWVDARAYCVRDDDFGARTTLANYGGHGFTITSSNAAAGDVTAFPNMFRGWSYGLGTTGPWPERVSAAGGARADLQVSQTWRGAYDAGYDMWFSTYPDETTHADGGEVMIWASHPGVAAGGSIVRIDGADWYLNEWITSTRFKGRVWRWPLVIFARVRQGDGWRGLRLWPFFAEAVRRGWIRSWWWWTAIEAGFELWRGGSGLRVTGFQASGLDRQRRRSAEPGPPREAAGLRSVRDRRLAQLCHRLPEPLQAHPALAVSGCDAADHVRLAQFLRPEPLDRLDRRSLSSGHAPLSRDLSVALVGDELGVQVQVREGRGDGLPVLGDLFA